MARQKTAMMWTLCHNSYARGIASKMSQEMKRIILTVFNYRWCKADESKANKKEEVLLTELKKLVG